MKFLLHMQETFQPLSNSISVVLSQIPYLLVIEGLAAPPIFFAWMWKGRQVPEQIQTAKNSASLPGHKHPALPFHSSPSRLSSRNHRDR